MLAQLLDFLIRFRLIIFLFMAGGMVFLSWVALRAHRLAEGSAFSLEREINAGRRAWSGMGILLLLGLLVLIFAITSPIGKQYFPSLPYPTPEPTRPKPTVTPTIVVILPGGEPSATPLVTATPTPKPTPLLQPSAGCDNPNATINSPLPGAVLSGEVVVLGVANTDNFAFYTLEISTNIGDTWLTVYTGNQKIFGKGAELGRWSTTVIDLDPNAGQNNFAFRLTVYDAQGHSPEPCVIPVTVIEQAMPDK
ncbi:MAG TPA: hypothetical protein PK299_14055 [Anaerolineales bacterium]|nr:hypothetical protein [Anaerolineales bacterium]